LNNSAVHNIALNSLSVYSDNVPQNNQRTSDCRFVHCKEYQNYPGANMSAMTVTPAQQMQMQTTNCALQDHIFHPQYHYQQQVDYPLHRSNVSNVNEYQFQQNNPLMEQCNVLQTNTFNDTNMFPSRQNTISQESSNFMHNTHNAPCWSIDNNYAEQTVEPLEYDFNMTYL